MTPPTLDKTKIETQVGAWVNSKQVDKDTQLVTAFHILNPPFEVNSAESGNVVAVTIRGQNDSVTIDCNRVLRSKYRAGVISLLTFDSNNVLVRNRHIARLTRNYQKILETFPPGSHFNSEELYSKVTWSENPDKPQAHARRRWKDLKYNFGFNVGHSSKANLYSRGNYPKPIHDPFPRPNDKKLREDFLELLTEKDKSGNPKPRLCNFCGCSVIFGESTTQDDSDEIVLIDETEMTFDESRLGLVEIPQEVASDAGGSVVNSDLPRRGLLDHRRPVFQGGEDALENLQLFCEVCNNQKNSVCRKCPYAHRCDTCLWAHPEAVRNQRLVLILDPHTLEGLKQRFGNKIDKEAEAIIKRWLAGEGGAQ